MSGRGRRAQPQILSRDPLGWFSICSGPLLSLAPPLLASRTPVRVYKAEDLSGEEESNKSMGVGEQELGDYFRRKEPFPGGRGRCTG